MTDANLVLGRLNPDYFLGGKIAARPRGQAERGDREPSVTGSGWTGRERRKRSSTSTNENMANAIRVLSIDRGLDPRDFALVAFGGAGPLHAGASGAPDGHGECRRPPASRLCSAFGALIADLQVNKVQSKNFRQTPSDAATIQAHFARLVEEAVADLRQEGFHGTAEVERTISMRYAGQNYEQDVPGGTGAHDTDVVLHEVFAAFERRHEQFYGYSISGEIIELIRFNVTAVGRTPKPELPRLAPARAGGARRRAPRVLH